MPQIQVDALEAIRRNIGSLSTIASELQKANALKRAELKLKAVELKARIQCGWRGAESYVGDIDDALEGVLDA